MDQERPFPAFEFDNKILAQGAEISRRLDMLRQQQFPPDARKQLRSFSMQEAARFMGVSPNNLKRLSLENRGPTPEVKSGGRRFYTAEQILELRAYLDRTGKRVIKNYVPHRKDGEKMQVIGVVNFKGGSGKTTTAVHLSQQLALSGHRVLALDLDPQASLSALFGFQPELDNNRSVYDALRYDENRCSMRELISTTNFPSLDIVPANLELSEYEFETPLAAQASRDGKLFFTRLSKALEDVDSDYDVVVLDCPPQLGYLTLTAVTAATSILITVHPEMLDLMSMSQFLLTLGNFTKSLVKAGAHVEMDWLRYLITRYEPTDIPQTQMLGFMQSMFAEEILTNHMLKSTAISDAGLTKQSLFEIERAKFNRDTYDRAFESMWNVNFEVQELIHRAWGRK